MNQLCKRCEFNSYYGMVACCECECDQAFVLINDKLVHYHDAVIAIMLGQLEVEVEELDIVKCEQFELKVPYDLSWFERVDYRKEYERICKKDGVNNE